MKRANHQPIATAQSETSRLVRHVLVVSHDAAQRRGLAIVLKRARYEVIEAASVADAIRLCQQHEPDIVLSDWTICGPDGIESGLDLCRVFRAGGRRNYGYFLLLTSPDEGDIALWLDAGADDFLPRPLMRDDLLVRLAAGERILRVEEELRASNEQLRAALARLRETQAAIDRDLAEARKLQQGLVKQRSGRFGAFQLSMLLRPAGHIGGDLVGFFPIGEDRLGIYALDVSGHGVTAALLTAQLSVHLSGSSDQNVALRAAQTGTDAVTPGALAHFFNNMMLEEMETDTYYTMIYADLNHVTGRLRMVQAGHPHPFLQRADGSVRPLGNGGMPIGVFENPIFDEIEVDLEPGDRLLICSDGITEAASPSGRLLGDEGVEAILRTNSFLSGHVLLESMAWSVSEYCRGERQDDISAVLIEYLAPAAPMPLPRR